MHYGITNLKYPLIRYSKNGYRFDVQYRKVIEDTISSDHRPVQVIVQVKGK